MAEIQRQQRVAGHDRDRLTIARRRNLLPDHHRYAISVRALSWGAQPAMHDLVGGHIDLKFDMALISFPHARAGRIKVLALADKARLFSAPDVRTVDEAGLPGFYMSICVGLWAPKGMPNEILAMECLGVRSCLLPCLAQSDYSSRNRESTIFRNRSLGVSTVANMPTVAASGGTRP